MMENKDFGLTTFAFDPESETEQTETEGYTEVEETKETEAEVFAQPEYEQETAEESSVEPAEEENSGEDFMVPEEFAAEFEQAVKQTYHEETEQPKQEKEKELTPKQLERRRMYKRRRMVAMGIIAAILLTAICLILGSLIKKWTRGETVNIGPLPSETVTVTRVPKEYDYSQPVAASAAADASYFDDAVLVGGDRVQCLDLYGVGSFGTLLYGSSISVSNALDYDCMTNSGDSTTLREVISSGKAGKLYLSLGINELGWNYSDVWQEDYEELIKEIVNMQSGAVIYLEYILPLSSDADETDSYFSNQKIAEYNSIILSLAQKYKLYCIDSYTYMSDATGHLDSSLTENGITLNTDGCEKWFKCFTEHTVNPDEYIN